MGVGGRLGAEQRQWQKKSTSRGISEWNQPGLVEEDSGWVPGFLGAERGPFMNSCASILSVLILPGQCEVPQPRLSVLETETVGRYVFKYCLSSGILAIS